jgi:hypothetical protein
MEYEVLSLSDLYGRIVSVITLIKKKIILILIVSIAFAGLFIAFQPKAKYEANTSLLLKGESGVTGGLLKLTSGFGFGGSSGIDINKIKAVASSRKIYNQLLEQKTIYNGQEDILGHFLIKEYEIEEDWLKSHPYLSKVNLRVSSQANDTLKHIIINNLAKDIFISETAEGLIDIKAKSTSSFIAFEVNTKLVELISTYFYNFLIQDQDHLNGILKNRLDSINIELKIAENLYAKTIDNSFGSIKLEGVLNSKRLERQLALLNRVFVEISTQIELAKFKKSQTKLDFQILDRPYVPLGVSGIGKAVLGVLGFLLGGILSVGFILVQNLLRKLKKTA